MRTALAICACALLDAASARAVAPPRRDPEGVKVLSDTLDPKAVRKVHRIALDPQWKAHEVSLEIADGRLRDLDVAVYDGDPQRRALKPVCVSQSTDDVESCRAPINGPAAWVEVTAASQGQVPVRYTIWYRPLKGPALEGTELYGDDADDLRIGHYGSGTFEYAEPSTLTTFKHLYALSSKDGDGGGRVTVTLSSRGDKPAPLQLVVFNASGGVVAQPERGPSAEVTVPLPSPAPKVALYALVRLANTQDIFSKPQYLLAAATKSDVLTVRLGPAGYDVEGVGGRQYELVPEGPTLAVITVDGIGTALAVTDVRGQVYPVVKGLGGARQSVIVGQPFGGSHHVFRPLPENTSLKVDVRPFDGGGSSGYGAKWQMSVRGPASGSEPQFLVDVVNREPEAAPHDAKRITGSISDGEARTIVLRWASPPSAAQTTLDNLPNAFLRGSRRVFARLLPPSDGTFDMAVSNRFGQVINIGSPGVLWTFSADLPEAFLTIFPKPGSPAQVGGPYEVEISEGTSLAK
jgi:hypothetical protein